jgi:hypothetical protein
MFNKQEVAVIFLIKSKKIDSNQTTRRQKSFAGKSKPNQKMMKKK